MNPTDPSTWSEDVFSAGAKALGDWIDIEGDLLTGGKNRQHHLKCVARDVFLAVFKAMDHPLKDLSDLGHRLHGVDLQFRRYGTEWPAPWRAHLVATKNERDDFRLTGFGNAAEEAIEALKQAVAEVDQT